MRLYFANLTHHGPTTDPPEEARKSRRRRPTRFRRFDEKPATRTAINVKTERGYNCLNKGLGATIWGLANRPELNGCVGTVVGWDQDKGRVQLRLAGAGTLLIRPENLAPETSLDLAQAAGPPDVEVAALTLAGGAEQPQASGVPACCRIEEAVGRGRYYVAARHIAEGEVVLHASPGRAAHMFGCGWVPREPVPTLSPIPTLPPHMAARLQAGVACPPTGSIAAHPPPTP